MKCIFISKPANDRTSNSKEKTKVKTKSLKIALSAVALWVFALAGADAQNEKVRKIRFVEDDAQNTFVSKIYELKNRKANDVVPFVLGAVKRYAANSSADRINYSAGKKQLVTVSCPLPLIPYIDDMMEKLDRPCSVTGPDGSAIAGTGIVRSVYSPVWRPGEKMMNIMIKAGIPSNAAEGANQDATVAFDAPTNRIYWKDSVNKDKDMKKYLAWLDRQLPQCAVTVNIYEIRENDLTDVGLDYAAWKNGPGLNLFDAGAKFLETSALEHAFGPYGFFMFAPSFDLSFVRILQQNGKAVNSSSATVMAVNGKDCEIMFTPLYQNLVKDGKSAVSVKGSANEKTALKIKSPVIALSGEKGLINFTYSLDTINTVERNAAGNEICETSSIAGSMNAALDSEKIISANTVERVTEQTVGVPFLCEMPVLKYIFGTTTKNTETIHRITTVKAVLVKPDDDLAAATGKLISVNELVNGEK